MLELTAMCKNCKHEYTIKNTGDLANCPKCNNSTLVDFKEFLQNILGTDVTIHQGLDCLDKSESVYDEMAEQAYTDFQREL